MESPLCAPDDPDFRLIETLAFRPVEGFVRRDRHLARMARTAMALDVPFDAETATRTLEAIAGDAPLRCRLTLSVDGTFAVTTGALAENPPVWRVAVAETRLAASDVWLRHKTTQRALYDAARASLPDSVDELLFLNERNELCEGTITNLFVRMPDGQYLTPPLSCGLLPGILREELIDNKQVTERALSLTDLKNAEKVFVGNSLRGLIRAELVG